MAKSGKANGNMVRPNAPWGDQDTIGGKEAKPVSDIPSEGWFISSGKTSMDTYIYYNGKPVENITSVQFEVAAGGFPKMKLEIIMPGAKIK